MTKVLVLYYSSYGHIETMAHAVAVPWRKLKEANIGFRVERRIA